MIQITNNEQRFGDHEIDELYSTLPDERIRLMCSFTTRLPGFLDILLSNTVMSSGEAYHLLGKVDTHRGTQMGYSNNGRSRNDDISFSTGFVSFKYSDASTVSIQQYIGGFGVLVPLDKILEYSNLGFSHVSHKDSLKEEDLNRDTISIAVNQARKERSLYDDGHGNVFELSLEPTYAPDDRSLFKVPLVYPRLRLDTDSVIAVPCSFKSELLKLLTERQAMYKQLYDQIEPLSIEELRFSQVDSRDFGVYPERVKPYISSLLRPVKLEQFPIYWYSDRNLNTALKRISIIP